MVDVKGFFKSKISFDEREKVLFELIERLDIESFDLFNEILDLDEESTYKIDSLILRSEELYKLFNEVNEGFEYLNKIELSSYDYAAKRIQAKRLLAAIITTELFFINFFTLAIISFIYINMRANKYFVLELEDINSRVLKYDEKKMYVIKTTLENCKRLLNGKKKKLDIVLEEDYEGRISKENSIIEMYINDEINEEDINNLSNNDRENIIKILSKDLNITNDNIIELLDLTKKKYISNMKLIKTIIN